MQPKIARLVCNSRAVICMCLDSNWCLWAAITLCIKVMGLELKCFSYYLFYCHFLSLMDTHTHTHYSFAIISGATNLLCISFVNAL